MATLIIGANGGIGEAVTEHALQYLRPVYTVSRLPYRGNHPELHSLTGGTNEQEIDQIITALQSRHETFNRVVITLGVLHQPSHPALHPEKRLEDINTAQLEHSFYVNTILPSLWVAKLLPLLKNEQHCVLSALSARVASIADNRLGGWYSYRASKAALNMALKTAAVEYARRAKNVKLLAFHPGTTDTDLSKPFQSNVNPEKLFSPQFVARQLFAIMAQLKPDGRLDYLDWQGQPIPW